MVESQSSKLVNLMQQRNERKKEVRRFREFLAELEDWLTQTEISVSTEVKVLSRKMIAEDIRVIEVRTKCGRQSNIGIMPVQL